MDAPLEWPRIAVLERRELGQSRECEVHLRDRTISTIMLQLLHKVRRKMCGIGQLEQSAFRVSIRDDRLGLNLLSRRQQHARGCSVLHTNLNDLRTGANVCTR